MMGYVHPCELSYQLCLNAEAEKKEMLLLRRVAMNTYEYGDLDHS